MGMGLARLLVQKPEGEGEHDDGKAQHEDSFAHLLLPSLCGCEGAFAVPFVWYAVWPVWAAADSLCTIWGVMRVPHPSWFRLAVWL